MTPGTDLMKLVFWLTALVLLLSFVITLSVRYTTTSPVPQAIKSDAAQVVQKVAPTPPPPTAADMIVAQDPHGFQLFISYSDRGFEPKDAKIHSGDTVRFTDNSSEDLWIGAAGPGDLYPGTSSCGTSALDTCHALKQGEYWQFTFTKKGTWGFMNTLDKTNVGVVHVQ